MAKYRYIKAFRIYPDDYVTEYKLLTMPQLRKYHPAAEIAVRINAEELMAQPERGAHYSMAKNADLSIKDCSPVVMACINAKWRKDNLATSQWLANGQIDM